MVDDPQVVHIVPDICHLTDGEARLGENRRELGRLVLDPQIDVGEPEFPGACSNASGQFPGNDGRFDPIEPEALHAHSVPDGEALHDFAGFPVVDARVGQDAVAVCQDELDRARPSAEFGCWERGGSGHRVTRLSSRRQPPDF